MKNLKNTITLVALFAFLFNNAVIAQSLNISKFLTEKINTNDKNSYNDIVKSLGIKDKELGASKLHILKNGIKIIEFQYKAKNYDKLYIVIPKDKDTNVETTKTDDLIYYTKDFSKYETGVYNKNKDLLYKVAYDKEKKVIHFIRPNKSAFQDCMAAAEEAVTDDFLGWVAWEYSPGVKLAAAIYCALQ